MTRTLPRFLAERVLAAAAVADRSASLRMQ
jgi:hypothetical protein